MRIAILSPFYPYRGGLAQLNAKLYTELSRNNIVEAFNFSSLYPSILFPGKTQYVQDGDPVAIVDNQRLLNSVNPLSYIVTAKHINNFAPDILIIPYWLSFLAPALGSVARLIKKRTKIVSLVHNAISHEPKLLEKTLASCFFSQCDAFITMSEPVRSDLLRLKPNANIILQPHPIYDHYSEKTDRSVACERLSIDKNKKNLLFFGLIRDYKGLDILIEAFGKLDDSYQLIIAGECYGSFDKYKQLIDRSPFKDNIVVFEQYIPDDMVSLLFSAADVLVLPYKSATQSGVVAVAFQLETPMIATNVGALGTVVSESHTGLVIDEADINKLTTAIREFFSGNQVDTYKANLIKEKTRLSWSNFIQSIESFFGTIQNFV